MQNFPKIVRKRLKAADVTFPSAEHPDADILTAFAEHSLPGRERDGVLEHLARCGECRDIVALSMPAAEIAETVVRPAAGGWLTWPALRWGFAAAGVVAIASLGLVQYQQSARSRNVAAKAAAPVEVAANPSKNEVLQTPALATPSPQSDKAQSDKVQSSRARSTESMSSFDRAKKTASTPGSPSISLPAPQVANGSSFAAAEPLPHGPKVANLWQQQAQQQANAQNQAAAQSAPFAKQQTADNLSGKMQIPPSSQMVEVESAAAPTEAQNKNLDASPIQDLPVVRQPPTEQYALARVGKAKPAIITPANDGSASMAAPAASGMAGADVASAAPAARWSISSSGALRRSYDQGATWQVVDVIANSATSNATNANSAQIGGNAAPTATKDAGQALKRSVASPTFRAVAANGADVWAGSSGGLLFHSLDAGDHWTRVLPASTGASLTGDIVSLEFVDSLHGKVSTSTAETWITSDAGQTWQKQ